MLILPRLGAEHRHRRTPRPAPDRVLLGDSSPLWGNQASCQFCHGTDYRGTVLSKMQADRTMAGRTFAKGTIIGRYSCHNGPNP